MNKKITLALACFITCNLYAENRAELLPEPEHKDFTNNLVGENIRKSAKTEEKTVTKVSLEDLKKDPKLLERVLDKAIETNQIKLVELLLPFYIENPNHDKTLVTYAKAKIAISQGDTKKAIELYQDIINKNPDLTPTRFYLAQALMLDGNLISAREEFNKVKADKNLPKEVEVVVDKYLEQIAKQNKWKIDVNAYYIDDKNVNNSANLPPETAENCGFLQNCTITYPQGERAHGFGFGLNARKDFAIADKNYWRIATNNYGKYYWDKHNYTDITTSVSTGLVHRSAKQETSVMPYVGRRMYGDNTYSKNVGINFNNARVINNNFTLFSAVDIGRKSHPDRKYLDGVDTSISNTLLYRTSPKQYFTFGLDFGQSTARDESEEYKYGGIRTGWGRNWSQEITTNLSGGILKRYYQAENFFGTKRQDDVYYGKFSIHKNNWQLFGITPQLVARYQKNDSNQKFYTYDKSQVYLDFLKNF
ncbi:MAG: DUF560 domain-containing protein [Cardiobacteriaceae bacterium]|nr:DUF560 domain-containing protein [Cardiobacteriaceae bacterium]